MVALNLCLGGGSEEICGMNVAFVRTAVLAGNVKVLASWSV